MQSLLHKIIETSSHVWTFWGWWITFNLPKWLDLLTNHSMYGTHNGGITTTLTNMDRNIYFSLIGTSSRELLKHFVVLKYPDTMAMEWSSLHWQVTIYDSLKSKRQENWDTTLPYSETIMPKPTDVYSSSTKYSARHIFKNLQRGKTAGLQTEFLGMGETWPSAHLLHGIRPPPHVGDPGSGNWSVSPPSVCRPGKDCDSCVFQVEYQWWWTSITSSYPI